MARRSEVLELAVLGLLHEGPLHGYELRKRLNATLGVMRAFSYGSLYPCLKALLAEGLVTQTPGAGASGAAPADSTRSRIVYQLTADGKEHFVALLGEGGPSAWDDDTFGVRLAFFGRTEAATRLRILEGRRSRLEERMDGVRSALTRSRERVDGYTLALQQHGLESVEREVRWLSELIDDEHRSTAAQPTAQKPPDSPVVPASDVPPVDVPPVSTPGVSQKEYP